MGDDTTQNIEVFINGDLETLKYDLYKREDGYLYSILKEIKKHKEFEYTINIKAEEQFEDSLDMDIPDIVIGVEDYRRNRKSYHYLKDTISFPGVILTKKDKKCLDLKKIKRVIYVKTDFIKEKFKEAYGKGYTFIPEMNEESAMKALAEDKGDIYIEDFQDYLRFSKIFEENDVFVNKFTEKIETIYYIGLKKSKEELMVLEDDLKEITDKGKRITRSETLEYLRDNIGLTEKSSEYLKEHGRVKVYLGKEESYFPFYYEDKEGNKKGFLFDYFYELEQISGLHFSFFKGYTNHRNDVKSFILEVNGEDINANEYMLLDPYYSFQFVIFNRKEDKYIDSTEDINNYIGAVVSGSIFEDYLNYKRVKNLKYYYTYQEALKGLENGEVDYILGELQSTESLINSSNIKGLKVAGIMPDRLRVKFGVKKDREELFDIMSTFENNFKYLREYNLSNALKKDFILTRDYKVTMLVSLLFLFVILRMWNYLKRYKKVNSKLKKLTLSLIETLEDANLYNDEDTGFHIKRVNLYSKVLAEKLGLPKKDVDEIGRSASLHDIGKVGISDYILKKKGSLTEEEFEHMKEHTEIGYNLVKNLDLGTIAENIIRYHHERWDGTGYLKGLKGDEIPIEARIVAISDVYDALRQKRSYKEGFSHEKSMRIIILESGKHFDPKLIEIFKENNKIFDEIFKNSVE